MTTPTADAQRSAQECHAADRSKQTQEPIRAALECAFANLADGDTPVP